MKTLLAGLSIALVMAWGAAGAQPQDEVKAERARISEERGRVEARFAAEEKACYAKFGVNDCLQEARTRRREVLADLRRQEVSLNDADRRRRGAERLNDLEKRSSAARQEQAAARQAKALDDQKEREQRQADKAAKRQQAGAPDPADPAAAGRTTDRRARPLRNQPKATTPLDTQANAQAFEERRVEAQERKAKAEKKLAERTKPAAKPLPLPP